VLVPACCRAHYTMVRPSHKLSDQHQCCGGPAAPWLPQASALLPQAMPRHCTDVILCLQWMVESGQSSLTGSGECYQRLWARARTSWSHCCRHPTSSTSGPGHARSAPSPVPRVRADASATCASAAQNHLPCLAAPPSCCRHQPRAHTSAPHSLVLVQHLLPAPLSTLLPSSSYRRSADG
jgi:hypothetical protein